MLLKGPPIAILMCKYDVFEGPPTVIAMCKYLAFKGAANSISNVQVLCFQRCPKSNFDVYVLSFQRGFNTISNVKINKSFKPTCIRKKLWVKISSKMF